MGVHLGYESTDDCACCHTETDAVDQLHDLPKSQYANKGPAMAALTP